MDITDQIKHLRKEAEKIGVLKERNRLTSILLAELEGKKNGYERQQLHDIWDKLMNEEK